MNFTLALIIMDKSGEIITYITRIQIKKLLNDAKKICIFRFIFNVDERDGRIERAL